MLSASDIVGFWECEHRSALDRLSLDTPLERAQSDEQMQLIQDKGFAHEANYLAHLESEIPGLVKLSSGGDFTANLAATRAAMADGAEMIFQAALSTGHYMGYADFLKRVPTPSRLGNWSYEVIDTKLAHRAKPKFMIQLAHYSALVASVQGVLPQNMHLVFGNHAERSYRVSDYRDYYWRLRQRFELFLKDTPTTAPEECAHCSLCDWRERCAAEWEAQDHLNRVANISKINIKRLRDQGVGTLAQLGRLPARKELKGISSDVLNRLRSQAALQFKKQKTGKNLYELLPRNPEKPHGFDLLLPMVPGDLYFDMEGDPLMEGGLEYLFGIYYLDGEREVFKDFWAHDAKEEKLAFEQFIDFVMGRLSKFPDAHIFHYAPYETTALKRLMSIHGTREIEVDQLLREKRFVDLFRVVRNSIRVSEPRYSIKNLEVFYMDKREGEVTNAGASTVYYEKWRVTHDDDLLQKIRDYNEYDCRSAYLLHQWLTGIKPASAAWIDANSRSASPQEEASAKNEKVVAHEDRVAKYEALLLKGVPSEISEQDDEQKLRTLLFHFLNFHRRAAKPAWWSIFARRDMSEEELIDDMECIAGLTLREVVSEKSARSRKTAIYGYPEQEFKLKLHDSCIRTDSSAKFGEIVLLDEDQRIVHIEVSAKTDVPEIVSISVTGPINTDVLNEALFRVADALIDGDDDARAILDFLRKLPPRIKGHELEQSVIDEGRSDVLSQVVKVVANLDHSSLFIQGPPGAGKTYTGSHVIVELLLLGFRVGITSNSHKAIHNILQAVEACAKEKQCEFRGAYKASSSNADSAFDGEYIFSVPGNGDVVAGLHEDGVQLVAGTAWLFCDARMQGKLDYLFVDEAGQVAAANLAAMGLSAKNLVLLGDQMQLAQPIQGVHPGQSGLSALDFLLGGLATIPLDRGVFLPTTWRMHPKVCQFISDAIYEGRLHAEPRNAKQQLVLRSDAHPALKPSGIVYVPVAHDGCKQRSDEEAQIVLTLYQSLMQQLFRNHEGNQHPMTADNILVVAPYNVQVDLLKRTLPEGARVGTVDKFQGQEAEVVIVSMTTSNADCLPRNIEFLYSKNRLNVAISRAKTLAIVVASPALADIPCSTVEQMGLVNLMCKVVAGDAPIIG